MREDVSWKHEGCAGGGEKKGDSSVRVISGGGPGLLIRNEVYRRLMMEARDEDRGSGRMVVRPERTIGGNDEPGVCGNVEGINSAESEDRPTAWRASACERS